MEKKNLMLGAAGGAALLALLLRRFAMGRRKRPAIPMTPTSSLVDMLSMQNHTYGNPTLASKPATSAARPAIATPAVKPRKPG